MHIRYALVIIDSIDASFAQVHLVFCKASCNLCILSQPPRGWKPAPGGFRTVSVASIGHGVHALRHVARAGRAVRLRHTVVIRHRHRRPHIASVSIHYALVQETHEQQGLYPNLVPFIFTSQILLLLLSHSHLVLRYKKKRRIAHLSLLP